MIPPALSVIVPLARRWVDAHEARIRAEGVPLTAGEVADAQLAGVMHPGRVRLMRVDRIPMPLGTILRWINRQARVISAETTGITFGHGIYIRDDAWGERRLVVHELVHVAQYERLGGTTAFLRAYLRECLNDGYPNGPLEQEAIVRTREICGDG